MLRVLIAGLVGIAITFGLFVFMAELVSGGAKRYEGNGESVVIDIVMDKPKSSVQERRRTPPPPPPPPKQPPKTAPVEPDQTNTDAPSISLNVPSIEVNAASAGIGEPTGLSRDGDATPIVRIEPKYPIAAARDGKEGWVQLRFTIAKDGSVKDVEVIDAEPKRLFDKEAKRALRKWKYKPKFEDGKAVEQPGMQVQLDFKLGGEN